MEGVITALRREMKIAEKKKGLSKLPKMKSKVRKMWERISDLGFHDTAPRRQTVATGCM